MSLFKKTDTVRPAFIIEAITKTKNNREIHKLDKTKNLEFHVRQTQDDRLVQMVIHEFYSRKISLHCAERYQIKNKNGEIIRNKCTARITVVPKGPLKIVEVGKKGNGRKIFGFNKKNTVILESYFN